MRTHIHGARVIDPASALDQITDLFLEGGKIAAFGQAPSGFVPERSIDASGLVASPGLVDLAVALREPGYSRKGSIASQSVIPFKKLLITSRGSSTSVLTDGQQIIKTPASVEVAPRKLRLIVGKERRF